MKKVSDDCKENMKEFVETLPGIICQFDLSGRILMVNSNARKILGYTKKDIEKGLNAFDIFPKREIQRARDNVARMIREKGTTSNEYYVYNKSGEELPFLISSTYVKRDGKEPFIRSLLFDISARKKAQEQYKSIFDNSIEGIFQTTKSGKYLTANPALAHIYGYSSAAELMESIGDIATELYVDKNRRREFINKIIQDGKIEHFESEIYRKDKKKIWISETARVVRDNSGRIKYFEGHVIDITEKKQSENQLIETNERVNSLNQFNRKIIDGIRDEVIVIDPVSRNIVTANLQVLRRTGLSIEQIKKKRCYEIYNEGENTCSLCRLSNVSHNKKRYDSEKTRKDPKTGKQFHLDISLHPLLNRNGDVHRVIHIARDRTKKRNFEKELSMYNEKLVRLYNTSSILQKTFELGKILKIALKTFEDIGFERIRIYMHENGHLKGVKSNYISDDEFRSIRFPVSRKYRKAYKCINSKKPVIDVTESRRKISKVLKKTKGLESASLPLLSENRCVGMISFDNKHTKRKIKLDDLHLLMTLANQIASSIEGAKLHSKNLNQLNQLSTLYDITNAMSGTLDMQKIMNMIVIKTVKLMKVDRCSILLADDFNKNLIPQAVFDKREVIAECPESIPISRSVSGKAIEKGAVRYVPDVAGEKIVHQASKIIYEKKGIKTMLSVPMFIENRGLGVINIFTRKERIYSDSEIALLNGLANSLALVVQKGRLYNRIKMDKDNFSTLLFVSQEINKINDLDSLMDEVMKQSIYLSGAEHGIIMLKSGDILQIRCSSNNVCSRKGLKRKVGEGIIGWVAKHGKPQIINDTKLDSRYIQIKKGIRSTATIPLIKKGTVMGVLHLESPMKNKFKNFAKSLGILTNHIAVTIEKIRLYEEVLNFNKNLEEKIEKATRELQEKNTELKKMDLLKSEFVSNVSHELRTPLTSIGGYTKLLLMEKLGEVSPKQKNALNIISQESERLARLINDVLDLSKLESGKIEIKLEKVDIVGLVKKNMEMLKSIADEKKIRLVLKAKQRSLSVECGKDLITQVIINLVNNAIKFTEERGKIEVIVEKRGKFLEVRVKDNGKGIEEENIPKLFNKFYQVDSSMTREQGGTGLGLVIVNHIIEHHNGNIDVESVVGQGSTFIFRIPLRQKKKIED